MGIRAWFVGVGFVVCGCGRAETDRPARTRVVELPSGSEVRKPKVSRGESGGGAAKVDIAHPQAPNAPPQGFVDLAEHDPDLRLDIRYATSGNFTGAPLPGYRIGGAWLTTDAANSLSKVQAELALEGLGLVVFDAYRPKRATQAMVRWAKRTDRTDLLEDGYIAKSSNHARGNTVDVSLWSADGELDMGTAWDTFSTASHFTAARGSARENRRKLRSAMQRHGFRPYAKEWWHFTFVTDVRPPGLDEPYTAVSPADPNGDTRGSRASVRPH